MSEYWQELPEVGTTTKILEAIPPAESGKYISRQDLMKSVDPPETTINTTIHNLVHSGRITKQRRGRAVYYQRA